ncbi:hypothetical protein E2C01_029955 [Portunus trituberculatus]|uniref:Uncharacterized protein n=1 Tax=Portunus trituberculatus TaxID=210409 RepID=A0A5B7ESX0_PORTR|nr:hypothetical protein [Portunus trituberculatus]
MLATRVGRGHGVQLPASLASRNTTSLNAPTAMPGDPPSIHLLLTACSVMFGGNINTNIDFRQDKVTGVKVLAVDKAGQQTPCRQVRQKHFDDNLFSVNNDLYASLTQRPLAATPQI